MQLFDINATREITCPYDKSEPKVVFTIKTFLDLMEAAVLKDGMTKQDLEGKTSIKLTETMIKVARLNLVSVKNLVGHDGKDFKVETLDGKVTDKCLQFLSTWNLQMVSEYGHLTIVDWIGFQIWTGANLSNEEKKTSESPSVT